MDRYHVLADATMTSLLERLEDLLGDIGDEGFEVDYHVSCRVPTSAHRLDETAGCEVQCHKPLMEIIAEWRINAQPRFERNICDQQAASKQANLAFVSRQVRPTPSMVKHPFSPFTAINSSVPSKHCSTLRLMHLRFLRVDEMPN